MKDNQLIYIAFGSEIYQIEAFFSISSAIAKSRETPEFNFDIHIYTDAPEFYKKLPVQVHTIKKEWYGDINYHFRAKHAVVYENAYKYKKTILIDTDTFFKYSPKTLFEKIKENNILCNSKNTLNKSNMISTTREVLEKNNLLKSNFFHTNSGVIGINKDSVGILKTSIEIIDCLYPQLPKLYTLEELALALAISQKNVEAVGCEEIIHHYWSRKSIFRKKVETWYVKHKNDPTSTLALDDTLNVTDKIPKPPAITKLLNKTIALSADKKYRQFVKELLNANYKYSNEFDNAASQVWIEKAIENLKEKHPLISESDINKIKTSRTLSFILKNRTKN